jgi:hypothetical protein
MSKLIASDYLEYYKKYFFEFNRLAVGKYADLSYGNPNPNPTAGSLESIIAYYNYIDDKKVKVLDSGAGASSWMLRSLFNDVISNDPNNHYLEFIELICNENNIKGGVFQIGFENINCDHVYYDYGDAIRMPHLTDAIRVAKKSVYVDDTNHRPECFEYREYTINLCKELGFKCFDLADGFDINGRGGLIIEK